MWKNERGLGLVELLLTLAVLLGIIYLMAKQRHSSAVSDSTRKKIESQGISLPPGVNMNNQQQVEKMVQDQLRKAQEAQQKNLDCSTGEGGTGCSVGSSPEAAASP